MGKSTSNSNVLKDPGFQDSLELDPVPQAGQCPQTEAMSPEPASTPAAPQNNAAFHLPHHHLQQYQCGLRVFILIKDIFYTYEVPPTFSPVSHLYNIFKLKTRK